jgi:adenine phosphoribosyltransferase
MKLRYYKKHIVFKNTKGRCNITPIFENPKVFQNLINDLTEPFKKIKYNKLVALDALGFILGSAIAYKTKKPLILIRKKGKFPYSKKFLLTTNFTDYTKTKKGFEIKKDSINKNDRVLLIDEWIETGTQAKSAIKLIEKLGAKVIGITTIKAEKNNKTKILFKRYNCKKLL